MKNLIEYILIHIVDHPEDVKVEVESEGSNVTYIVTVHEEDMGRVIGKKGAVIQSIRTIARVRAIKEGERARIVVADTNPSGSPVEAESTETAEPADTDATLDTEPETEVEQAQPTEEPVA